MFNRKQELLLYDYSINIVNILTQHSQLTTQKGICPSTSRKRNHLQTNRRIFALNLPDLWPGAGPWQNGYTAE